MKEFLKTIKLNESAISMVFGAFVVLIGGFILFNTFRNSDNTPILTINPNQSSNSSPADDLDVKEIIPKENKNVYIVKYGDSLWSIAEEKYGTGYEWTEIAKANPNLKDGAIEVGQEIVIPETNKLLAEAAATTAPEVSSDKLNQAEQVTPATTQPINADVTSLDQSPTPNKPVEMKAYIVQRGDNLWKIAESVYGDGYRWSDIAKANNLANPNIIHSGNNLTLPS